MRPVLALLGLLALVLVPAPTRAAQETLGALFQRAEQDPSALPELIASASARLARAPREEARAMADRLEPFCRRAYFSPERFPGMERLRLVLHEVRSGENPERIARQYGIGHGLLARLNQGFEPRSLRVGQKLKVLDLRGAQLRLVVDLEGFRLSAWCDLPAGGSALLLQAPVGLGAPETPTPLGSTRIVERVLDPSWTHPLTKELLAPKDPRNGLGGYWIRLEAEGIGKSGIGLHGYTLEEPAAWLEKRASNGCVRMRQDDVDRVFHLALEGTPVWLVE